MSGGKVVPTLFNDQQQVVQAIEQACPEFRGKIKIGVKGQNGLRIQMHDKAYNVDIAIQAEDMAGQAAEQGYSPMGLVFTENGTYDFVISDCDMGTYEKLSDGTPNPEGHYNSQYGKYGEEFQKEISSSYNALESEKKAKKIGWNKTGAMQPITDEGQNAWGAPAEIDSDVLNAALAAAGLQARV